MCLYNSVNNFNVSNVDKNIKSDQCGSTSEQSSCQYPNISKNKQLNCCISVLQRYKSLHDILNLSSHDELYQEDNYEEKLLPPNIFKLAYLNNSNLTNYHTEQLYTSSSVKRTLAEDEPSSVTNSKRIKKELTLKSYRRNNLYVSDFNESIYKDAIKKIDIDSKGIFKNSVLEELDPTIKDRGFIKSSADLSATYFNLKKYILEKVNPFLNEITPTSDIVITPGMSISDLIFNCISNSNFFEMLSENCRKMLINIRATFDEVLPHILQNYINFKHNDSFKKTKIFLNKKKLLPIVKELVIDTVLKLPDSIIHAIEKFDQNEVISSLFIDFHDVFISKSFMKRNIIPIINSNKNKFVNKEVDNNLIFFNNLLEKIGNLLKTSCIFNERVILLGEYEVEQLAKYLLSDICGMPAKFHKKLKLNFGNIEDHQKLIDYDDLDKHCKKNMVTSPSVKELQQFTKINLENIANTNSYEVINKIIEIDGSLKQAEATSIIKNNNQLRQYIAIKELNLRSYHINNLRHREHTSSIYEHAIQMINIDNMELFKNSVLRNLNVIIKRRNFTKSFINLSLTYSNVRKYVLDIISPHIDNIILTADIKITHEMSISDIKYKCLSNTVFFKKLDKVCKKTAEKIVTIPDDNFSHIIQSHINFDSEGRLNITHRKNEFFSEIKSLIIETISNLPQSIINEINKFEQNEILTGVFSVTHGILLPKNLIRTLNLLFNRNMLSYDSFECTLYLSSMIRKIGNIVKEYPIFHKGKLFFLNEYAEKTLSTYLLGDIYGIYDKTITKKLNCDINFMPLLGIYEQDLSMIVIDKEEFENSFIDKLKQTTQLDKYFTKKGKVDIDLSLTYSRVKNYMLEKFYHFLKEVEENTKIKLYHGMTLDDLKISYISNEKLFHQLRMFCSDLNDFIKNCTNSILINLIQCVVYSKIESSQKIVLKKDMRAVFHEDISMLLIKNIPKASKAIVTAIKSLTQSKLVKMHFSLLDGVYVNNTSLIKIKLAFEYTQNKVENDKLLISLVNKIALNVNTIDKYEHSSFNKIINSHIVFEDMTAYDYITKLVKEEIYALKNSLAASVKIINNGKIENADQKIMCKILGNIESHLIEICVNSYKIYVLKHVNQ